MPQVPDYGAPRVGLDSGGSPKQNFSVPAEAFGTNVLAAGADMLGTTIDHVAAALDQHSNELQALSNKASADQAFVAFTNYANDQATNYTTTQRGVNALPALPKVLGDLETQRKTIESGLSSPMARAQFQSDSRRQLSNTMGALSRHAATEQNTYVKSSSVAKINTSIDDAAEHYNDPARLGQALATTEKETRFLAAMEGHDKAQADQDVRVGQSKALTAVLKRQAADSPLQAQAAFAAYAGDMTAEDSASMAHFLKSASQPYIAATIADSVIAGRPTQRALSPQVLSGVVANPQGSFSRILGTPVTIISAVRTQEQNAAAGGSATSEHLPGNGHAWDISVPGQTSAQTASALAASGVPFDQIIDEGNHVHFGIGDKQMRGQVMIKTGPKTYRMISSGPKASPRVDLSSSTAIDAAMPQLLAHADQQINEQYGGDPVLKAQTEQRLVSQLNRQRAAYDAASQASRNNLLTTIDGGVHGDGEKPIDEAQLLGAYKGAQQDWLRLTPTERHTLSSLLEKNSNPGLKDLTPQQWNNYALLDGESKSSPEKFAQRNILADPLVQGLPAAQIKHFLDAQDTIKAGKPIDPQINRALAMAAPFLKAAGFDKNATDKESVANYNAFTSALSQNVTDYVNINKKPPDQVWVRQMTQSLLLQHSDGFLRGSHYNFEKPETSGLVHGVPNEFTQKIIQRAQQRGLPAPTNAQIAQIYGQVNAKP